MHKTLIVFLLVAAAHQVALSQPSKTVTPDIKKMRESIDSAMDERDYAFALKKCDALLKLSPGDSVAMQRKVGAFFYLDRIDECIAQTPKAFKNRDTAAYMLGYLSLQDQNENTDSATVWKNRNRMANAGLVLNPHETYCNASKAILMSEASNFDSSYFYIDRAIQYAGNQTKPWARIIKAALYHDDEKNSQCYDELKSIINDFPEYDKAYIQLVQIYRSDKMYPEAMAALDMHSKKFDAEKENLDLKFYILRDWNKKDEACEVSKDIGTENNYVMDEARKIGCTWMFTSLLNNDGGTYTYNVENAGDTYDFIATKTGGSYNGDALDFKWNITSGEGMQGAVKLSKAALDTAHEEMNLFSKGDVSLTDKTTVWISRSVFNDLLTKGETYINADGQDRLFKVATQEMEDDYQVENYTPYITYNGEEGKMIKLLHIYTDDGSGYEMWINHDANNPMIIKMKLDFSIELKEVRE